MDNAFTLYGELQAAANRCEADLVSELRGAADRLAIGSNDDISLLDPGMFRRRPTGDFRD